MYIAGGHIDSFPEDLSFQIVCLLEKKNRSGQLVI
jgi:hypothetical protein